MIVNQPLVGARIGSAPLRQPLRDGVQRRAVATRSDAAPKPLLHLWSLAVEEQVHLVFPLLAAFGAIGALGPGVANGAMRPKSVPSGIALIEAAIVEQSRQQEGWSECF